ncbi:hypothetical protein RN001_016223 [Aquatica leii]|uniref:Uncharacterized protein n=1 Tax=Aquatica leii TaxID=1421715 RepID=A0AAN7SB84_9COLE|nr:hypothetical protein RN001_016223 [Aquatica leii]
MLDKCSECPGLEGLLEALTNEIDNLPKEVVFKQWVHTDRADLITRLLPKDEFLNHLKMVYFSDGASQYKNKKNFINLCQHDNDFGLIAEWNFFATSHGKNSCDGIGGTTKREDMFKYCAEKITGITYIFVSAQEIKQTEAELMKRFELCLTVKGTRGYHRFVPVNDNEIRCFTTSTSEEFDEHNCVY